jgi:outer membrane receptor protein involved in Fe transport
MALTAVHNPLILIKASPLPDNPPKPTQPMSNKIFPRYPALLLPTLCAALSCLEAQQVENITGEPALAGTEIVELSPFEVSAGKDYGYQALSSLSGSRLSTDLWNTPAAVSVLTKEFLDDFGAMNVQEALVFASNSIAYGSGDVSSEASAGSQGSGEPVTQNGQNAIRVRGIRNATITRNFFTSIINADNFNVERIDISRGPNALLFGDASSGGTINVATRSAFILKRKISAGLLLSSFGGWRLTADANVPVGRKAAIRANLMKQELDGWRDYQKDDRTGAALAATFQITRTLAVKFEGEYGKLHQVTPPQFLLDRQSGWEHGIVLENVGDTFLRRGLAPNLENISYNLGRPELGVYGLAGTALTQQIDNISMPIEMKSPVNSPIAKTVPIDAPALLDGERAVLVIPGYDYSLRAAASDTEREYYYTTAFIEKKITNNVFMQLAANYQTSKNRTIRHATANRVFIDVNKRLPDHLSPTETIENPDYLKPYTQSAGLHNESDPESYEFRFMTLWNLRRPQFDQNITFMASHRDTHENTYVSRLVRLDGVAKLSDDTNLILFRANMDQRGLSTSDLGTRDMQLGTIKAGYRVFNGSGAVSASDSTLTSLQLASVGSWTTGRRLFTTLGIRRDFYHATDYQGAYDETTDLMTGLKESAKARQCITSSSLGAVYHLTPWLAAYGNKSESFAPSTAASLTITGEKTRTRIGKGSELGFKFRFLKGRITGSIGYYEISENNNVIQPTDVLAIFNRIYNTLQMADNAGAERDVQTANAYGCELEIMANVTKGWSLMLNAALPKSELTDAIPYCRAYVAQNRDAWATAAAALGGGAPAAVGQELADLDHAFNATYADGQPVTNVRKYTVNMMTRYRFGSGFLKGFVMGGGVNLCGENYIMVLDGKNMYAPAFQTITAFCSYQRRIRGLDLKFQANVYNLLDDDGFAYMNYGATGVGMGRPQNYRVSSPRELRFMVTVGF